MSRSNNKPAFEVFVVTKTGQRDFWHKVGVAWIHTGSKGLNIQQDLPVAVTDFVLLPPKNEKA